MKKLNFFLAALTAVGLWACNYDSIIPEMPECGEEVTYQDQTREIIGLHCATAGCHVAGGDGPNIYTTYNGLKTDLELGNVENVIRTDLMPPLGSPDLSPEDRETLLCWIEDGYPEN